MPNNRKTVQQLLLPLGITALFWVLSFSIGLSWVGELPPAPSGGMGNAFYYLVKSSILWVPLGFIFAVAGRAVTLQRWLLSALFTFLIVAPLSGAGLELLDYLEAVYALIGTWVGLWIGARMQEKLPEPVSPPEPASPPEHLSPPEHSPPAGPGVSRPFSARGIWLRLPLVVAVLGLVGWAVWGFSRWQIALGAGLLIYFLILLRFRHAWLFALPALLPVLNLAPWTGRLSLDEFDLVMLVTLAGALVHGVHPANRPLAPRPIALLLGGYAVVCIAAFFIGLLPFPVLAINSFDNYFSQFNSWNVGKGFLWGFLFLGFVRWTLPRGSRLMERLFVPGLLSGFIVVALVGMRERWQFADLLDFSVPYRITATFSTMHTGGAHLDAYLALLVPFIGYWVVRRGRPLVLLGGVALFFLAVYLVISTVTRTTFVVLIMEMALLILFWLKGLTRSRGRRGLTALYAGLLVVAVAGPLLYLGTQGAFFQKRLASVERDTAIRLDHWSEAVGMMDDGVVDQTLGMGFGRFPAAYLDWHPGSEAPGRYHFEQQGDNTYLRLQPGKTLYLAQKVPVTGHSGYRLALDVKSQQTNLTISIPVCEKHLLNSHRCRWSSQRFDGGDDQWHHLNTEFNSGDVGTGNWLSRRPVELFLYNPNKQATVDVDNVSLRDAQGNELLSNGSFSSGGDYWFFKTHAHLPWHVKNLWVSALFEQGWLGVTLLTLLMLALLIYLSGPAWQSGQPAAAAVVVAIIGLAATGLFDSPLDAPRITLLFFAVVSFGLYET